MIDRQPFAGFDPAAIAVLDELPAWPADTYAASKSLVTDGLIRPARAFVGEVAAHLDADLTTTTRGSVSPMHRDRRFTDPGTARYKDHLLMTMWGGDDKRTSPILWIRLDARRVGVASGIAFTPTIRDRWRSAIGSDAGTELAATLGRLRTEHRAEVVGARTKRVPARFDDDHPRADLLRLQGFQIRYAEPLPPAVAGADFVAWTAERLERLLPVHRWLRTNLTNNATKETM